MLRMLHQIEKTGHLLVKTPCWKYTYKHAVYKVYTISRLKYSGLATPVPLVPDILLLIYYFLLFSWGYGGCQGGGGGTCGGIFTRKALHI